MTKKESYSLNRVYKVNHSAFKPIGAVGIAFVGPIVLLLFVLRFLSIKLVLSAGNTEKEVSMAKTLTANVKAFSSSALETIWAIGVSSVASCLSS